MQYDSHEAFALLRILTIDLARGSDCARHQFRAVAGAGFHIEHLHSRLDPGESQHLAGLATCVGLPVGVGPIR